RLRAEQPHALDKIVVLPGDITELGLGLSQEHRALLQREVSVVYHVAASVRFDDPFRKAVFTNLRSTREVVELARGMPQLKVLVHVSTAYTNINRDLIEERVYEPHLDWRQVIRMAEQTDPASLWAMDCLGPKLRDFHPNSYTFTKALAEKLIDDVASELPVVLVRPSIVTPTFRDPFPGWVDNLYGLGGVWAAGWKGLIRVTPGDGIVFDTVPADVVTKTTILASWARGRGISIRPLPDGAAPKGVEVVNATVGNEIGCSHRDMMWGLTEAGLANDLVFPGMIRDPKYQVVSNPIAYELLKFYHHILYGLVLDTAARITGRKPRAMKMYRIIEGGMEATLPFQLRQFKFELVNQRLLQILMHPADEDAYCIMEFFSIRDNLEKFKQVALDTMRGVLVYALKEEDSPDKYRPQLERQVTPHGLRIATAAYYLTLAVVRRLMGSQANSYVFTKALAEQLLEEVADELPVVITRPSIVVPTFKDPIPGWIDNLYGLSGFWAGGFKGLMRIVPCKDLVFNSVPADVATKNTVLASWHKGIGRSFPRPAAQADAAPAPADAAPVADVVNVVIMKDSGVSFTDMSWVVSEAGLGRIVPFPGAIRPPKFENTPCHTWYLLQAWYHHYLFGFILDMLSRAAGIKPRVLGIYRTVVVALDATQSFWKQFDFDNDNLRELQTMMHPDDERDYCIMDLMSSRDSKEALRAVSIPCVRGILKYTLKEEDNPEKNWKMIERLKWVMAVYHTAMGLAFCGLVYSLTPRVF
ncbi:fatty acyl-CoA reductase wat-like, partial [Frankliniella occidentalis]|uniref:Fatty acyl-CoA reductase n=1 Tax=Frankliniella occidentalis TaxID=133901 RepID=A0A9C6XAQ4_FRAOC